MRELTDEEMIRAYDELEREMRELKNNIGKKVESSNTEAINAWRSRMRDAREKTLGDIEERALQLAMATERIRKRTYADARDRDRANTRCWSGQARREWRTHRAGREKNQHREKL